jgi:hypothetical protein
MMPWDSSEQLNAVKAAMVMADSLGRDVFIMKNLAVTCRPDTQGPHKILEIIRPREYK